MAQSLETCVNSLWELLENSGIDISTIKQERPLNLNIVQSTKKKILPATSNYTYILSETFCITIGLILANGSLAKDTARRTILTDDKCGITKLAKLFQQFVLLVAVPCRKGLYRVQSAPEGLEG